MERVMAGMMPGKIYPKTWHYNRNNKIIITIIIIIRNFKANILSALPLDEFLHTQKIPGTG